MSKPWHSTGMSPRKDGRMDMTQENFYRIIAMHDELILEQKDTIAKQGMVINKLQQQVFKLKRACHESQSNTGGANDRHTE